MGWFNRIFTIFLLYSLFAGTSYRKTFIVLAEGGSSEVSMSASAKYSSYISIELFWRMQCSIVCKSKYHFVMKITVITSSTQKLFLVKVSTAYRCQLLDCVHVAFIFLHFLSISHNLFYFLWVYVFWPASFCVVNASSVSLKPLSVDL